MLDEVDCQELGNEWGRLEYTTRQALFSVTEPLNEWARLLLPAVQLPSILDSSHLAGTLSHLVELQTRAISGAIQALQASILLPSLDKLQDVFELELRMEEASEITGWLPYRTMPFAQYAVGLSGTKGFVDQIRDYYAENQNEVITDISLRLDNYSVASEHKDALREALEVHQLGYFRLSCCGVLPLIEKVLREDWFDIAGLKPEYGKIQNRISHQPLGLLIQDGRHEWVIVKYIIEKLYAAVRDENLEEIQQSLTPNRHAASHGWAVYNANQHSLNVIVTADYVLRVASALNGFPEEEE